VITPGCLLNFTLSRYSLHTYVILEAADTSDRIVPKEKKGEVLYIPRHRSELSADKGMSKYGETSIPF
jgi:hypothetical protein